MKWLSILILLSAFAASAADLNGTWKGTADSPNGPIERTFVFKVDGDKLTGETSSQLLGKSIIQDGKVKGDEVTFWITVKFQENEAKLTYTGKVAGDQIKFHVETPDGAIAIDYVAKKIS